MTSQLHRGTGRTQAMLEAAARMPEHIPLVLVGHNVAFARELKARLVGLGVDESRVTALKSTEVDKLRGRTCRTFIDHHAASVMSDGELLDWKQCAEVCHRSATPACTPSPKTETDGCLAKM